MSDGQAQNVLLRGLCSQFRLEIITREPRREYFLLAGGWFIRGRRLIPEP